ncbi:MAG TPA: hypothetical protein VLB44_10395 [Kofleriaceae bacterium]|nr:hypothetical protein [Kofleriaceae bacterium]
MERRGCGLLFVAACGFQHGALPGAPDDAPSETSDTQDLPDAAVADAPPDTIGTGAWTNIAPVLAGSPVGDDDPTLTADLLEIYFNRNADIYVATRTSIGQPWNTPVLVSELSSAFSETTPEVTSDGLFMLLASGRTGTLGANDIWVSTRAARNDVWGAPVHVAELSSTTENAASAPTDDRLQIVQIGNPSGVDVQMYTATRATATGTFSSPTEIPGANSGLSDFSPMLSQDRLTLYFDSNRSGNEELYVATRTTANGTFATPTIISELATTAEETDPWVSPDGHHIFFVRGGVLYEASR